MTEFDGVEVREIPGWPRYLVSSDGRAVGPKGIWLRAFIDEDGYHRYSLRRAGKRWTPGAHQIVALAWIGPKPSDGLIVCHNNGDPGDNRVSNLRWDTPENNNLDMIVHGTHGEASRTLCTQGHELDGIYIKNDREVPRTVRYCLTCNRIKAAKRIKS